MFKAKLVYSDLFIVTPTPSPTSTPESGRKKFAYIAMGVVWVFLFGCALYAHV